MTGAGPSDAALATPPAAPAPRSRFIAVLLAAVIPGAGHLYARRPLAGLIWMAAGLAAYASFLLAGLAVHGLCMVSTVFVTRR
jgi:hypothetical protein